MDQPATTEPPAQPSTPPRSSLISRLLNVFAIPGEVFEEVKVAPRSNANWLAPSLLLLLVSWVGMALIFSQDTIKQQLTEITDKAIQQQVEKAKMSEAQAEQARKFGDIGVKINMSVFPLLVAFITPFFWGLMFWVAGAKVMGGNFSYMKAVEVVGLASTIMVLEAIVKILLIILSGNLFASPSLAFFVKQFDTQNSLHAMLASVNVMTIWLLIVRSIGLARLSAVSFSKAAVWVFGIWMAYTAFFIGLGAAMKAIFAK